MENVEASLKSLHGSALAEYSNVAFDPALTPDDIGWIASVTGLPVVVKGVLRADDAVRAVDAGAAGVIVSNHGGRQLDGAVASADALAPVVDAVGDRVPVLVDGGIRGGYDVLKALLWGLAVGGQAGAAAVMAELTDELRRALTLAGVTSPAAADRSLLA
jgi:4-hydroxymandelate oxidase